MAMNQTTKRIPLKYMAKNIHGRLEDSKITHGKMLKSLPKNENAGDPLLPDKLDSMGGSSGKIFLMLNPRISWFTLCSPVVVNLLPTAH